MALQISVSRDIAAPAERVWEMVSDLSRMGEWSPENTGGLWVGGATGPALGANFKGTNRNGWHRWSTKAVVSACNKPTDFEFDVSALGMAVARWGYHIEATETGCTVTETFTDLRSRLVTILGSPVSGVSDRERHNRSTMQETLSNLASAAQSGQS